MGDGTAIEHRASGTGGGRARFIPSRASSAAARSAGGERGDISTATRPRPAMRGPRVLSDLLPFRPKMNMAPWWEMLNLGVGKLGTESVMGETQLFSEGNAARGRRPWSRLSARAACASEEGGVVPPPAALRAPRNDKWKFNKYNNLGPSLISS